MSMFGQPRDALVSASPRVLANAAVKGSYLYSVTCGDQGFEVRGWEGQEFLFRNTNFTSSGIPTIPVATAMHPAGYDWETEVASILAKMGMTRPVVVGFNTLGDRQPKEAA